MALPLRRERHEPACGGLHGHDSAPRLPVEDPDWALNSGACWMGPAYPNATTVACGEGCLFKIDAEHVNVASEYPTVRCVAVWA